MEQGRKYRMKKIILLGLVVILCIAFAGCNTSVEDEQSVPVVEETATPDVIEESTPEPLEEETIAIEEPAEAEPIEEPLPDNVFPMTYDEYTKQLSETLKSEYGYEATLDKTQPTIFESGKSMILDGVALNISLDNEPLKVTYLSESETLGLYREDKEIFEYFDTIGISTAIFVTDIGVDNVDLLDGTSFSKVYASIIYILDDSLQSIDAAYEFAEGIVNETLQNGKSVQTSSDGQITYIGTFEEGKVSFTASVQEADESETDGLQYEDAEADGAKYSTVERTKIYDESGFTIDSNEFMAIFNTALKEMPDSDKYMNRLSVYYDSSDDIKVLRNDNESGLSLSFEGNEKLNIPMEDVSIWMETDFLMGNYSSYRSTILNIMGALPYSIDMEVETIEDGANFVIGFIDEITEDDFSKVIPNGAHQFKSGSLPATKELNGIVYTLSENDGKLYLSAAVAK